MATFSQNLLITELTPGDPATLNTWGATWNTNLALIDSSITGELDLNVGGSSDIILTSVQGQPDQSRNVTFIFTGALTGNIKVFWPENLNRNFRIINRTTGNFTLTAAVNNGSGAPAGVTFAVPQDGTPYALASNGTSIGLFLGGYLPNTGGNISGNFGIIRDSQSIAAQLTISGDAGQNKILNYDTDSVLRFNLFVDSEAESGSAAGSNMILAAYLNNGTLVGDVFKVFRNTQSLQFFQSPTMPTPAINDSSTNGATTLYVDRQAFSTASAAESFTTSYAYPLTGGGALVIGGALQVNANTIIGTGLTATTLSINGAAGTNRGLVWGSGGSFRWNLATTSTAEGAGNAGSNLVLQNFDNTGALLSNVFTINRGSGVCTFGVPPNCPTAFFGDASTIVATTAFVNNTIAMSAVSTTTPSGTGVGSPVRVARISFTAPLTGAEYVVTGQIFQTFAGAATGWYVDVFVNGVFSISAMTSVIAQNAVFVMAKFAAPASGPVTVDLRWGGQNGNVAMSFATLMLTVSQ